MDISLPVLMGLEQSLDIDATKAVGNVVRWYEILTLIGIVFAISEFMERTKLRTYIFKLSSLSKNVFELIIFSILTIVSGNIIIPLIETSLCTIPLLHYPAFWEVLSLASFTGVVVLILYFSLFPYVFIPKITLKNYRKFYCNIYNRILNDLSHESLGAVAVIIHENIDMIFKYASRYDKWWNIQGSKYSDPYQCYKVPKKHQNLVNYLRSLIDKVLSTKEFCKYLSENNIGLLLGIIDATNRYDLSRSCGNIFYTSLCRELFLNPESHLSKELEFRGQGIEKPVYNALFRSLSIVDNYRIFEACELWNDKNIEENVVRKYMEALDISIGEYISEHGYGSILEGGPGGNTLYFALERPPHILNHIFLKLKEENSDQIFQNLYKEVIYSIESFYRTNLEKSLLNINKEKELYGDRHLKVAQYSVIGGVCNSIFSYLESLVLLKDDNYARHLSISVFWAIFPVKKERKEVFIDLERVLLEMIKKRIDENKKGSYGPFMRLLINIYGFQFSEGMTKDLKIGKYVEEEFKSFFAPKMFEDENFAKKFLPKDCQIDKDRGVIKDSNGNIIFKQKVD